MELKVGDLVKRVSTLKPSAMRLDEMGTVTSINLDTPQCPAEVNHTWWPHLVDLELVSSPVWGTLGLPLIGTQCEMFVDEDQIWVEGGVIAHVELDGVPHAVASDGSKVWHGVGKDFRPFKTPEQLAFDEKCERVAMYLLGTPVDVAPGINWVCHRSWTVNEVRRLVREALEREQ